MENNKRAPMSSFSKNERCFLAILNSQGRDLKTSELFELTDNFPDLCSGCKSGNDVIAAGMRLIKKEKITRSIGKGGFLWSLV